MQQTIIFVRTNTSISQSTTISISKHISIFRDYMSTILNNFLQRKLFTAKQPVHHVAMSKRSTP